MFSCSFFFNPGQLIEPYFSLEAAEQQSEEEEINTATITQSPVVNINGAENDAMRVFSATVIFR